MPSRRILRLAWAQAVRQTRRELRLFGLLALGFIAVATVDPYRTVRPNRGEAALTLRERLGYAVLLRAGYVTARYQSLTTVVDAPAGSTRTHSGGGPDPDPSQILVEEQSHPDLACLVRFPALHLAGGATVDSRYLAEAIVASERYNRPPITRRFEIWIARMRLAVGGTLPDYSIGVAQVRPSRARALLDEELGSPPVSDNELLELLRNDCQNVRLAARYVDGIARRYQGLATAEDVAARTALIYSGGLSPSVHGLRYIDAVAGAYTLLVASGNGGAADLEGESPPSASDSGVTSRGCFIFGIGSPVVTDSTLFHDVGPTDSSLTRKRPALAPGDAQVVVYLWQSDPGPPSYVERLARRRRQDLLATLVRRGYRPQHISFVTLTEWQNIFDCGREEVGQETSQAQVVVKGGR